MIQFHDQKRNREEEQPASRQERGKERIRKLRAILYPERCALCDCVLVETEREVCAECREHLPFLTGPLCYICGRPVDDQEDECCPVCRRKEHVFLQSTAPFPYSGRIQRSILRMKYGGRPEYADFYGRAMAVWGRELLQRQQPEIIVPVPVHSSRYRTRGYNQAELLARQVSRLTGIPMNAEILQRCRRTRAQKGLDLNGRQKNLEHAFRLKNTLPCRRILVVDDIYTTGSTLDAVSSVLRQGGVEEITALCACVRP